MVDRGSFASEDRDFHLTTSGEDFVAGLGIDLDAVRAKRRMSARKCPDRTERWPHLAGFLGAPWRSKPFRTAG